jgi:flagellar hook-basal body complex protein FliE
MSAINSIGTGPSLAQETQRATKPAASAGGGFINMIDDLLGKINVEQATAEQAVTQLAMGQTDNLHGVMVAVAKADLSFRMFLEIRNRLTDAVQEIMRMQV